jgi:methylenetetrahydrofolate dehydrogenase (NADP+)/methenyltetrahydrofolate cyclohydrolase
MTGARIIDGRALAARIKREVADQVAQLGQRGIRAALDVVMVGDPAAGEIYARSQRARCEEVGIEYRLHTLGAGASADDIRDRIRRLNDDPSVTGILLNLPLPEGIDTPAMQYCIDPYKDVEGVNPSNIGLLFYDTPIVAPCTALAVREILKDAGVEPRGMDAVVVGQGAVAGKPIALFLMHQMATVACCHIATRDLARYTREADLLITAAGRPGLIRAAHVKPGAVVIDVGISSVPGPDGRPRVVGDVVFDDVKEVAGVLTPVPGGVGPVTVAILLRSAAHAAQRTAQPRRLGT